MNTGGPAFPTPICTLDGACGASVEYSNVQGMNLRDYFAGQALNAIMGHCEGTKATIEVAKRNSLHPSAVACAMAYEMADFMIAQREKPVEVPRP